jgi:hypothetical protein
LDIHIGIDRTGYTDEFPAIQPAADGHEEDIPPLTRPLEAIASAADDAAEAKSPSRRKGSSKSAQLPVELVEAWTMLVQLTAEIEQEERTFAPLPRDLGILSRGIRHVEGDINLTLDTFDTIGNYAEQMRQAGGSHVPPLAPIDPSSSAVMGESSASMPLPRISSRPLSPQDPVTSSPGAGNDEAPGTPPPGSIRLSDLVDPEMPESPVGSDEGDAPQP